MSIEAFIIGARKFKELTGIGKYEVVLFCGFTWFESVSALCYFLFCTFFEIICKD